MNSAASADNLLSRSDIIEGFRRAFNESDVGGENPVEQGGFILRDPIDGKFAVVRLPARERDSLSYPICSDGGYQGKQIVGSFHTHPNTGPEWQQEPSPQDIRLSQDYPETMGPHQFVIAAESIYHIDNEGAVSEIGCTLNVLGLNEDTSP